MDLLPAGRELPYKYTTLGVDARSNFVAAVSMVNHELDKILGKERAECTTEEFRRGSDCLEEILQTLVRRVKKAESIYEQENTER